MRKTTLRSRLILGFGAVIVPLLVLLMYNNWYAMQVVRYQVAGSNQNLVRMSMDQVDSVLEETDKYLSKTALQDPDLTSLSSYPSDSPEAFFVKVNTLNQLSGDIAYYSEIEAFFAYGTQAKELLLAPQEKLGYDKKEQFKARLEQMLDDSGVRSLLVKKWTLLETDGEYSLLRVVDTQYGSYVGAWVDLGKLLKPLDSMEFGDNSQVLFASPNGRILTQGSGEPLAGIVSPPDLQKALTDSGQPYNILRGEAAGSDSMVVSRPSHAADIYLAVLQPERSLLEKLPAFQRLIYATPLLAFLALVVYLYYLQRSITLPVHKLIRGMLKLREGELAARLEPSKLAEFTAINDTFNDMARQIKHLKIDIYEEQIRTQKAELKHLQAQIHPHFFMNCLNLIFNLAQVKNTALVQKIALYLVRHFRFTTRTNVSSVTLADELEHIRNYLNLQSIRFPEALNFEITASPDVQSLQVPPLTVQPFVENAMEHGFANREDEPFTIRVTAGLDPDSPDRAALIRIEDNGDGFSPDMLEKLVTGNYFRTDSGGHIGIWNVQHRCRLFYKSESSLAFGNKAEGGAVVTLRLPLPPASEQEKGGDSHVPGTDRG
ncbi:histidine kinase [Paenibacillus chitinolyticus]|uniref:sensor histidine kinase n=1 Tax=Paenibacillus chitinolyticus TaxID=79263 RepID=UPI00386DE7B5